MENLKKTALYHRHLQCKGEIVEFCGWALPIKYEGIIEEHEAVRNAAGIFDVSHMGEVEVIGKEAYDFVQNLVTNDVSTLEDNQVLYSMMCYPNGGVVDDLLIYKFSNEHFYLVINAANVENDYKWMIDNKGDYQVELKNISSQVSEIAIQGPNAEKILQNLTDFDLKEIKFFYLNREVNIAGVKCLVSRTGYTGEDGFEIYTNNEDIKILWDKLLEAGKDLGLKPAGLGARDTLRFEASLPLYGHEISQDISPLEAGLSFFVKLDKDDFIGKEALVKQKAEGLKRVLRGFEMIDRGIAREGFEVFADEKKIGVVTTGYYSPTLKKNIGLALIDIEYADMGRDIEVEIRNKRKRAKIINKRFYKKNYKK